MKSTEYAYINYNHAMKTRLFRDPISYGVCSKEIGRARTVHVQSVGQPKEYDRYTVHGDFGTASTVVISTRTLNTKDTVHHSYLLESHHGDHEQQ